jgi:hypothetical protein
VGVRQRSKTPASTRILPIVSSCVFAVAHVGWCQRWCQWCQLRWRLAHLRVVQSGQPSFRGSGRSSKVLLVPQASRLVSYEWCASCYHVLLSVTSAVQRRHDSFLGVSTDCKIAANKPIFLMAVFLIFQDIRLGCCTVAAHLRCFIL